MKLTGYILILTLCVILPDQFIAANDENDELITNINQLIQDLVPATKKVKEDVQKITDEHQKVPEIQKVLQTISESALNEFFNAVEELITELKVNYGNDLKHYRELQAKRTEQIHEYIKRITDCAKQVNVDDVSYELVLKCNERHPKMIAAQLKDTVQLLKEMQKQIYKSKTRVQDCLNLLTLTENNDKANKDSISQTLFCLGQIAPELASDSGRMCARTAVELKLTEKFFKQTEYLLLHCYADKIFETEMKLLHDKKFDVKQCAKKQEKQPE